MVTLNKVINRRKDALRKEKPIRFNEEGEIILTMSVRDDTHFLSPYSTSYDPVISQDLMDFLTNCYLAVEECTPIELDIYSNCISDDDKTVYTEALKNSFELQLLEAQRKKLDNKRAVIFSGIGGLITLIILAMGTFFDINLAYTEFVDIFSWVLIWACLEAYVFKRTEIKYEIQRLQAFCKMNIKFLDIDINEK